jgi:hypothetical protein
MARIDRNDGSVADAHAYLLDLRSQPVCCRQAHPPLSPHHAGFSEAAPLVANSSRRFGTRFFERGSALSWSWLACVSLGLFFWGRGAVVGDNWGSTAFTNVEAYRAETFKQLSDNQLGHPQLRLMRADVFRKGNFQENLKWR